MSRVYSWRIQALPFTLILSTIKFWKSKGFDLPSKSSIKIKKFVLRYLKKILVFY